MRLLSNIRKDISLRNATIYAQWSGVLAATIFVMQRAFWLTLPKSDFGLLLKILLLIRRLINIILFPFCVLGWEIPVFSHKYWGVGLLISRLWCTGSIMIDMALTVIQNPWHVDTIIIFLHFPMCFVALITLVFTLVGYRYFSLFRSIFYFGYTIALVWGAREIDLEPKLGNRVWPHFEVAQIFSVLSSLLYGVAWWLGQEYVFSRTLGGSGVENMALYLSGQEPHYDPIDEEEGRIRLP